MAIAVGYIVSKTLVLIFFFVDIIYSVYFKGRRNVPYSYVFQNRKEKHHVTWLTKLEMKRNRILRSKHPSSGLFGRYISKYLFS